MYVPSVLSITCASARPALGRGCTSTSPPVRGCGDERRRGWGASARGELTRRCAKWRGAARASLRLSRHFTETTAATPATPPMRPLPAARQWRPDVSRLAPFFADAASGGQRLPPPPCRGPASEREQEVAGAARARTRRGERPDDALRTWVLSVTAQGPSPGLRSGRRVALAALRHALQAHAAMTSSTCAWQLCAHRLRLRSGLIWRRTWRKQGPPTSSGRWSSRQQHGHVPGRRRRLANCAHYSASDRVLISVNGRRADRVPAVVEGKLNASTSCCRRRWKAGATIIGDPLSHRPAGGHNYNIGEQEIAEWLCVQDYEEIGNKGVWRKIVWHTLD